MKNLPVIAMLCLLTATVGCEVDSAANKNNVSANANKPSAVDYQNGVYYFAQTGSDFANALSSFKKDHPELEIEAIAGNGTGIHGYDEGYFVSTRRATTH